MLLLRVLKMLELFMPLWLTWKTIWSVWMVVSLMLKILSIIQKSIARHFMKRYHWYPSIAYELIMCRYFLTPPVLSMASTGHLALLGFLLLNSVNSCRLRNWTHPLQELPIFLNVFWPSVIFQPTLMYALCLLFLTCCHLTCGQGSIEFMSRYTSIDSPFALYDAHTGESHSNTLVTHFSHRTVTHSCVVSSCSMSGPGIVISSIDNMPAQIPRESTDLFGAKLLPYINEFVSSVIHIVSYLLCTLYSLR